MLRGHSMGTVDDKGRLKLPSQFRTQIEETWGSDFYVTSVEGKAVQVYPLSIWEELEERLAKLSAMNPTKKKFLDRTNYYGQVTSLDKAGRILIPANLRESALMTGEVAVLGNLNYLDVWNLQRFRARIEEEPFTEEDKTTLSELGI
jgi:MraZ protein